MKICFLTQTAHDISDYYKEFFKDQELFFLTFKSENKQAISFLPKSTWSDGRNKLWELVKGKYDYYVFIDDDLLFYNYNSKVSFSPLLSYAMHKLHWKSMVTAFQKSSPEYFVSRLKYYLSQYKPEVLSVTQLDYPPLGRLDTMAMKKNSFVRRMGYFDAQFTVFSNYAASTLLPYDTNLSGWWSAQLPVYLYSYHVFASKAISVSELGVKNLFHAGEYVENYDGVLDCRKMINKISEATGKDYSTISDPLGKSAVDFFYGENTIKNNMPKKADVENYRMNFESSLKGIEKLMHSNLDLLNTQ